MSLYDDLVGLWSPFLGASGYRLLDRSGRGNHGTLTNMDAGTDWRASTGGGTTGYALDFDGSNDRVDLGRNLGIAGSFEMSVSMWVYLRAYITDSRYFHQWGNTTAEQAFVITATSGNNRRITLATSNTAGSYRIFSTSADVMLLDVWTHVVCNMNNATGVYEVWVSGVQRAGTYDASSYSGTIQNGSGTPAIGGDAAAASLSGLVDDVRLYRRVLTPAEIIRLSTSRGYGLSQTQSRVGFVPVVSGATGDLSVTLGAATLSSSGTLANGLTGSLSRTLDAASLSSSGTVADGASGSLTATLDAATLSASGAIDSGLAATSSKTLDNATLSSSGTLEDGQTGTLSATLGAATLSSSGTLANGLTGALTKTLDNATLSATGSENAGLNGSLSTTLGNASLSASGTVANGANGSLSNTLDGCTVSASGSFGVGLAAQLNKALDSATVSASGTVANGLTGALSVTLASATLAASGSFFTPGAGTVMKIRIGGVWRDATPYVKAGGVWREATPYIKVNGEWK